MYLFLTWLLPAPATGIKAFLMVQLLVFSLSSKRWTTCFQLAYRIPSLLV